MRTAATRGRRARRRRRSRRAADRAAALRRGRIAIAFQQPRLVDDPQALLVDEPASALDHGRGVQIVELVVRLARELDAVAHLVTHDEATLGPVAARVHLVDGRLVEASAAV